MIRRRVVSDYLVPAATLLGVLLAWEAATRAFRVPRFVMPAPSAILAEGWDWRYRFLGHAWVTLYETLGGFALSIAVGVPLAVLIVYSPVLRSALYPLIVLAQSVPKIAIAPVLLLMVGHGEFTFVKVRLPMAMPFVFAGAKVAITLAVIGAVVGEFVGSDKGLGYVILSATSYWKTELAFSSMILLSLMAIVLFGAVSLVERLVCPWLVPTVDE